MVALGEPLTGKTRLAIAWAAEWQRREPRPLLVIDSAGATNFAGVPHVSLAELPKAIWQEGRSVAFHPRGNDEAMAALEAAHDARGVHLLIDESAFWSDSGRGRGGVIERIARSARHYGMTLAMTTQYAGADVSQQILACAPELWVFRTRVKRGLQVLEDRYGLSPGQVSSLENGWAFHGR